MRRQLVPGLVVRLTIIKAKTRPGIEAIHIYICYFESIVAVINPAFSSTSEAHGLTVLFEY